jgi:Flavin containing amine oxidoreductase
MPGGRLPPLARSIRDDVRGRITPATYSRRELLRMGGALGAGLALTACTGGRMARTSRPTAHDPRVVVVGAGLAGLTAAYRVTQAGVPVLALPFSTLRFVDLDDAGFGPERLAAIRGLGMGSDVKLLVQYDRRPSAFEVDGRTWSGGMDHTEPHFQTWESSAGEAGRSGLLTVYAGGRTGESWTSDEPHVPAPPDFVAEYVGHVDDVVPARPSASTGGRGSTCGRGTRGRTAPTRRSSPASTRGFGATWAAPRVACTSPVSTRRPTARVT